KTHRHSVYRAYKPARTPIAVMIRFGQGFGCPGSRSSISFAATAVETPIANCQTCRAEAELAPSLRSSLCVIHAELTTPFKRCAPTPSPGSLRRQTDRASRPLDDDFQGYNPGRNTPFCLSECRTCARKVRAVVPSQYVAVESQAAASSGSNWLEHQRQ